MISGSILITSMQIEIQAALIECLDAGAVYSHDLYSTLAFSIGFELRVL